MTRSLSSRTGSIAALLLAAAAAACSARASAPATGSKTPGRADSKPTILAPPPEPTPPDPRIEELTEQRKKLELMLLEKEALIQDLDQRMADQKRRYDEAILEVVRAKAKLRSMESRAEAASQMAETEIALRAFKEKAGGSGHSEMQRIAQMMTMSVAEFEKENFGGALYLSLQAKELIQDARRKLDEVGGLSAGSGEVAFSVPLTLKLTRPANVRQEPGLAASIVVTLKEGSPVTGYSHRGDWIRVKTPEGTQGWIHQSLLSIR